MSLSRFVPLLSSSLMKTGLALAAVLAATMTAADSFAQNGLELGGNCRGLDRCLSYVIRPNSPERRNTYFLRVPGDKLLDDLDRFSIFYPPRFIELGGSLEQVSVELHQGHRLRRGDTIPIREVAFDPETHKFTIYPQSVIPAGADFTIKLSNVHNPKVRVSYHRFLLTVAYQDGLPIVIGFWNLEVGVENPRDRN